MLKGLLTGLLKVRGDVALAGLDGARGPPPHPALEEGRLPSLRVPSLDLDLTIGRIGH